MNPTDQTLLNEAIALAQHGEKLQAYTRLKTLLRTNPKNLTLLLWIAFTAPDLTEADLALAKARLVDPNHPDLARARKWLEATIEAQAQAQLQSQAQPVPVQAEEIQIKIQSVPQVQQETNDLTEVNLSDGAVVQTELKESQNPFAINWAEYYPHLDERVPVPAWAKPVTVVAAEPAPEPQPEPEIIVPPLPAREPSRWTKMVKGFFIKAGDPAIHSG
jgi:hypothetical protein